MSPVQQQRSICFPNGDYWMLRKLQQHEGQGPFGMVGSPALMALPWSDAFLKANSPDTEQVSLKM